MTSLETDGAAAPTWADGEACTLPTAERPLRVAEFDELFATALRSVERRGHLRAGLVLVGGDDLAARTRRLTEAESRCCSFFSFEVSQPAPGRVVLDVAVPAAHADVLAGLVARAESVWE